MASTINASTSGAGGLITTADASGQLELQTAGTTRVTVSSSGNVGIGTISPNARLHVRTGVAGDIAYFTDGVNADFYIKTSSLLTIIGPNAGSTNLAFQSSGTERMRITAAGEVLVTSAAGLGYGTGAGGTVTQATSKSTAVTLNKPTGKITMNNAALAAGASVYFVVYNSLVGANDTVIITGDGSTAVSMGPYRIEAIYIVNGSFGIRLTNISGGSLSDAVPFNFAIIKGAIS